jgi:hypothetical protein
VTDEEMLPTEKTFFGCAIMISVFLAGCIWTWSCLCLRDCGVLPR